MYVITITGATFYVSKFPESFFPGKLHVLCGWCAVHQLWVFHMHNSVHCIADYVRDFFQQVFQSVACLPLSLCSPLIPLPLLSFNPPPPPLPSFHLPPPPLPPGKLNYLGSSHQWWHLMVVLAFAWTHHMTTLVFMYWTTHNCPATTTLPEDALSLGTLAMTAETPTSMFSLPPLPA